MTHWLACPVHWTKLVCLRMAFVLSKDCFWILDIQNTRCLYVDTKGTVTNHILIALQMAAVSSITGHWRQNREDTETFSLPNFGCLSNKGVNKIENRLRSQKRPCEKRQQREHTLLQQSYNNYKFNWDRNKLYHSMSGWGGRSTVMHARAPPLCGAHNNQLGCEEEE